MNISTVLNIIEIVLAVLLTITILIQQRGVGLGAAFGGEGNVYRKKRGAEKMIFYFTVVLSVCFLGLAFANLFFE